jgi:hypothetical protein
LAADFEVWDAVTVGGSKGKEGEEEHWRLKRK